MRFVQRTLEERLAALLGGAVSFAALKVSPLKGRIEGEGMVVASPEASMPLLTVRSVTAEVSVSRLLKKELAIRSLKIEEPVLRLIRQVEKAPAPAPATAPAAPSQAPAAPEGEGGPPSLQAWALEAQRVLLVSGEVHLFSKTAGAIVHHLAVEKISLDLRQYEQSMGFTLLAQAAGRRDPNLEIGPIRLTGELSGALSLADLQTAGLEARLQIGEHLSGQLHSTQVRQRDLHADVQGLVDLAMLLLVLPPGIAAVEAARAAGLRGQLRIAAKADYDPAHGLRVPELEVNGKDVTVGATASNAPVEPEGGQGH